MRLQKDEYFIADLIGVKVLDEQEQELGTLEDVIETGANDVYQIRLKDGRQLLLPAIKECVLDVDVEAGRMKTISWTDCWRTDEKMQFHILTLFPEMVENGLQTSILGRAIQKD